VHRAAWPVWDEALAAEAQTTVVVQVDGRLRDRLTADADSDAAALREMALGNERVRAAIGGRAVRDVIVAGRLVNVVTM
jgi:leucyl-tRNA synthetase